MVRTSCPAPQEAQIWSALCVRQSYGKPHSKEAQRLARWAGSDSCSLPPRSRGLSVCWSVRWSERRAHPSVPRSFPLETHFLFSRRASGSLASSPHSVAMNTCPPERGHCLPPEPPTHGGWRGGGTVGTLPPSLVPRGSTEALLAL